MSVLFFVFVVVVVVVAVCVCVCVCVHAHVMPVRLPVWNIVSTISMCMSVRDCMYANKVAVIGVLRGPLCYFVTLHYVLFSNYWSLFASLLQDTGCTLTPGITLDLSTKCNRKNKVLYIHNVQNLMQQLLPHVATDIVIHLYLCCHLCT